MCAAIAVLSSDATQAASAWDGRKWAMNCRLGWGGTRRPDCREISGATREYRMSTHSVQFRRRSPSPLEKSGASTASMTGWLSCCDECENLPTYAM